LATLHFEFHPSLSLCSGIDLLFLFAAVFLKLRKTHDGTWAAVYSMLLDFFVPSASSSPFFFTSFLLSTATLLSCLSFLHFLFGGVYLRICGEYGWIPFFPLITGGTLLNDMISFVYL
jgi:hypothetical protein